MGWTRGTHGRERLTKRADALRVEGRRRTGRRRLRWEDCVKRYLSGVGGEGRGERERGIWGVETGGGDNSETGSVMEKGEKIGIDASLTPDVLDEETATTIILVLFLIGYWCSTSFVDWS